MADMNRNVWLVRDLTGKHLGFLHDTFKPHESLTKQTRVTMPNGSPGIRVENVPPDFESGILNVPNLEFISDCPNFIPTFGEGDDRSND
jgi:hypothetical protein